MFSRQVIYIHRYLTKEIIAGSTLYIVVHYTNTRIFLSDLDAFDELVLNLYKKSKY